MEIERYTLATGETAVTGFTRLWKPWGVLFIVMGVLAWMWPGWATGGTTTLSFALGFSEDAIPYITIGVLVLIGVVLTVSPVVYQTVEKIQFFMVALIVLFIIYAIFVLLGGTGTRRSASGFVEVDKIPDGVADIGAAALLGAIAFAGAGGVMNLVQSNWVRDKGLGMGAKMPRVVSPFTGEEIAAPTTGYFFRRDEENMRRWNGWWKVANREQFCDVLRDRRDRAADLHDADLRHGRAPARRGELRLHPGAGRGAEGVRGRLAGHGVLADRQRRAVLDQPRPCSTWSAGSPPTCSRPAPLRDNEQWSESRLYFVTVWLMILFGSVILLSGVDQPLVLLVIAAALNGAGDVRLLVPADPAQPRRAAARDRPAGRPVRGDHLGRAVLRLLLGDPADRPGQAALRLGRVDGPDRCGDVHPATPDGRPLGLPVLLRIGHQVWRQRAVRATTRHQETAAPSSAITRPTWRAPPWPMASAIRP